MPPRGTVGGSKRVDGTIRFDPDAHTDRAGASENLYDPQDTK